jgi:tetratricopeptide (TPR) repeat protein
MKPARMNRVLTSGALLAIVATATVACTNSHTSSTPAASSTAGKGGAASTTSASQITSLLKTGITQAGDKDWSAAEATFRNILTMQPGNVYANYNLGVIYQTIGNTNEAIAYYNEALAANATYTPAMYNEAILLESTQPLQAIAVYEKIVGLNPKAATAYLRMALLQAAQGDTSAADANYAKAIKLEPSLKSYKLPAKQ